MSSGVLWVLGVVCSMAGFLLAGEALPVFSALHDIIPLIILHREAVFPLCLYAGGFSPGFK